MTQLSDGPVESGNSGFTLMELLITMMLICVVTASIINAYVGQQRSELSQEQIVEMQESTRAALHILTRHIRRAGYDPYSGRYNAGIIYAGSGMSRAEPFSFTYVADDDGRDNDNDDKIDEKGEIQTLSFFLYDAYGDGDYDLGMQVGGLLQALAENIVNIANPADPFYVDDPDSEAFNKGRLFTFRDDKGALIPDPAFDTDRIRYVEIKLRARPDAAGTDYTLNRTTRSVRTLVRCRNLGL